jgi:hypothetical protein
MLTTIGIIGSSCEPVWQDILLSTSTGPQVGTCRSYTITTTYNYERRDVACGSPSTYFSTQSTQSYTNDSVTVGNVECQVTSVNRYRTRNVFVYCDGSFAYYGPWSAIQVGVCPSQ